MSEKVERISRTVLWFTLALVFIAIPIGAFRIQSGVNSVTSEMRSALKKADDKIAELSKAPEKFTDLSAFQETNEKNQQHLMFLPQSAKGVIWFTNTTNKSGYLCLKGAAQNNKTNEFEASVPICKEIKPFDSYVQMEFKFTGGVIKMCPQSSDCTFTVIKP
jgi:hypothetical protein